MVTQPSTRRLKKDFSNTIKSVNDFITTNKQNITSAKNIHEEPMIEKLNFFCKQLTDYGDTGPENDENDKLIEQYEEIKTEAKAMLIRLQQVISKKRAEQKEKQLEKGGKENKKGKKKNNWRWNKETERNKWR